MEVSSREWVLYLSTSRSRKINKYRSIKKLAGKDQQKNGGTFCMAPGCSNSFCKIKDRETHVHFHNLPMKRPTVLRRWLAAMKRLHQPTVQRWFAVTTLWPLWNMTLVPHSLTSPLTTCLPRQTAPHSKLTQKRVLLLILFILFFFCFVYFFTI